MISRKRLAAFVATVATAGVAGYALLGVGPVGAADTRYAVSATVAATTTVVTPANPAGWTTADAPGAPTFSTDKPRNGAGALKFDTPGDPAAGDQANDQRAFFRAVSGPLSSVTSLSYDYYKVKTLTTGGVPLQVVSYQVQVDTNGSVAGGVCTLVYEPVYNDETAQQPILTGRWVTEGELLDRLWWSTCDLGVKAGMGYPTFDTLRAVREKNPTVPLVRFGLSQGSGNDGVVSYADDVQFNDQRFNFEPNPQTVNGIPSITFVQPVCGTVDVTITAPANSNPIKAIVKYNDRTYYAPTVTAGQSVTYRLVFREDSKDPSGVVRAKVQVFYQSPVTAEPVLGPTRFFRTNCR